MDVVGVKTVYDVLNTNPLSKQKGSIEYVISEKLKNMLEEGKKFYQ